MKTIDTTVLAGYNAGMERGRLRTGIGLIEFERTKEILRENCLSPRLLSTILEVPTANIPGGWPLWAMRYTCLTCQRPISP